MGRHGNGFGKNSYSDKELQFEDEGAKIQPWMIPVFAGILVVVMLLCVLIWALTHKEERTAGNDAEESKEFSVIIDDEETGESVETESETEESGSDENDAKESGEADTDANVAETEATSQEQDILEEPISGDTSMSFTAVDETVTAKDVLNLRSAPTTADSENVVAQLKNGESAKRIGVNKDTGWSKLEYAGDFSPLCHLTVQEVKAVMRECNLPEVLVEKVPIDGLCGKTDEDNLGFTYATLDRYIREGICEDPEIKEKIDRRHFGNLFKLKPMPAFTWDAPIRAKTER